MNWKPTSLFEPCAQYKEIPIKKLNVFNFANCFLALSDARFSRSARLYLFVIAALNLPRFWMSIMLF